MSAKPVRLNEAAETLRAIRLGYADAVVVSRPNRRAAVHRLSANDHPYRTIVEAMNDGAATVCPAGTILYCNDRFSALLGVPMDGLVGRELCDLVAPEDRVNLRQALRDRRGRLSISFGARGRGVRVVCAAYPVEVDSLKAVTLIASDQTALLHAEDEQRRLGAIVESSVDSIHCTDRDGYVTLWNRASQQLYGYSAEEAIGKRITFLAPGAGKKDVLKRLQAFREGLASAQIEVVRLRKGGAPISVSIKSWSMKDRDGKFIGIASITRDVTERRLAEQSVTLRRSEELQREVVANVSHDFKTPLAAIRGFTETLRQGAVDDLDNRMDFLASIERHVTRLTRMVDDVLDLSLLGSKLTEPNRQPVELEGFAKIFIRSIMPLFKRRRIKPEISIPRGLFVWADRVQLERALQNLCGNAIKFSRPRGKVILKARRQGGFVLISVTDFGFGIAKADLLSVFERFHRSAVPVRPGTGLGLAIVKGIVEAHGGRAWADSVKGKGSTFHFTLPSAEGTYAS